MFVYVRLIDSYEQNPVSSENLIQRSKKNQWFNVLKNPNENPSS